MIELTEEEITRYSRQLTLPEVGMEGQRKLKSTSVLIIGAGGLGSPAALYLAAAGIGRIGLVDDDRVDLSNLQRQVLHDTLRTGQMKVESAKERLLALNPNVHVDAWCERFNAKSAEQISSGYDILVDCSDNFATRYLVNDLCVLTQRPDVYAAVDGFAGQVSVFDARFGPCYRCIFPNTLALESSQGSLDNGVMGVVPGVIGALQAAEVIKLALQVGQPLFGSLLLYDALAASFQTVRLSKLETCSVCGSAPLITHL